MKCVCVRVAAEETIVMMNSWKENPLFMSWALFLYGVYIFQTITAVLLILITSHNHVSNVALHRGNTVFVFVPLNFDDWRTFRHFQVLHRILV